MLAKRPYNDLASSPLEEAKVSKRLKLDDGKMSLIDEDLFDFELYTKQVENTVGNLRDVINFERPSNQDSKNMEITAARLMRMFVTTTEEHKAFNQLKSIELLGAIISSPSA